MGTADKRHYVKLVSDASIGQVGADPGPGDPAPTPPETSPPVPMPEPPPASNAQNALVPRRISRTLEAQDAFLHFISAQTLEGLRIRCGDHPRRAEESGMIPHRLTKVPCPVCYSFGVIIGTTTTVATICRTCGGEGVLWEAIYPVVLPTRTTPNA